jgi:hypothetical protein
VPAVQVNISFDAPSTLPAVGEISAADMLVVSVKT